MNENLVIGLTGSFESGCTTIAEILENNGWEKFSLSNILKEIQGGDRGTLQDLGNKLRQKDIKMGKNGGILIRKAFKKLGRKLKEKNVVIECIKNPGEIKELKNKLNAYTVAVNVSFNIRWERSRRKKNYNFQKFEAEAERDKNENLSIVRDNGITFYYGQEVQKCVDLADIVIKNDINYDDKDRVKSELFKKIGRYIQILKSPGSRHPLNEELLMNNAYCTSLLSKCLKRQVGAIIVVKDRFVVSSGYNTVPLGQDECIFEYANKCYRDKKSAELFNRMKFCPECGGEFNKDQNNKICANSQCIYYNNSGLLKKNLTYGKGLDVCRSLHAEESAILQSSHLGGGVSLEGAALYSTTFPCMLCAKQIIDVGINKVVYIEPYPMREAYDMLKKAGVDIIQFEGIKAQAFFKLFKKYAI